MINKIWMGKLKVFFSNKSVFWEKSGKKPTLTGENKFWKLVCCRLKGVPRKIVCLTHNRCNLFIYWPI